MTLTTAIIIAVICVIVAAIIGYTIGWYGGKWLNERYKNLGG